MSDNQIEFFPGAVKKATAGYKSSDLWKVYPEMLVVDPSFNVRVKDESYYAKVRQYADSMKANGYMTDKPIGVFAAKKDGRDVLIVTDGHTRLDAVKLAIQEGADISVVPVVTKPAGTSMEDLTVALVTSNTDSSLSPFEVAVVCKRLIGYGMDEDEIATRLGYTPTYVRGLLQLMAAPAAIRKMVSDGKISATLAIDTLRKHGEGALDILKDAAQSASDAGGSRVTAKQVTKAREKTGDRVIKLPKPALKKSAVWLKDQGLLEDPSVQKFLSFLAGLNESDDPKALIDGLLEPKTAKKVAKNPAKVSKGTKTDQVGATSSDTSSEVSQI